MLRRTLARPMTASRKLLGGGGIGLNKTYADREFPNMPWHAAEANKTPQEGMHNSPVLKYLFTQPCPIWEDTTTGTDRVFFQEPCRHWHIYSGDDTLVLEEHDREEWNEKPYVTINHLYEPPVGSFERPVRFEASGNPGDKQIVQCEGDCAPHVPQSHYAMLMKGYFKNKCPMCQQHFYLHNRPWLVIHPDWTDEPAADEGPAFTFAEIESEFDRDFHEFGVYLNLE